MSARWEAWLRRRDGRTFDCDCCGRDITTKMTKRDRKSRDTDPTIRNVHMTCWVGHWMKSRPTCGPNCNLPKGSAWDYLASFPPRPGTMLAEKENR